jgi:hypothetical protein
MRPISCAKANANSAVGGTKPCTTACAKLSCRVSRRCSPICHMRLVVNMGASAAALAHERTGASSRTRSQRNTAVAATSKCTARVGLSPRTYAHRLGVSAAALCRAHSHAHGPMRRVPSWSLRVQRCSAAFDSCKTASETAQLRSKGSRSSAPVVQTASPSSQTCDEHECHPHRAAKALRKLSRQRLLLSAAHGGRCAVRTAERSAAKVRVTLAPSTSRVTTSAASFGACVRALRQRRTCARSSACTPAARGAAARPARWQQQARVVL